jgi:hypothetical protein
MSAYARAPRNPSAFQLEVARFRSLLGRALERWLNDFFDLSLAGPGRRSLAITTVTVGLFLLNLLISLPVSLPHLQILFAALLAHADVQVSLVGEIFFYLTLAGFLLIPLLVTSYYALELASNYLADVFELEHVDIARDFIRELALTGGQSFVRIRNGRVAEEDQDSPILTIGGPGLVVVEFDSVALFEKPDGTPHIIGPRSMAPGGAGRRMMAILDGFERFRDAIDLRDHYIGNPSGDALTVKSRSLDGIPISAADVRAVYSVHRSDDKTNAAPATKEQPYAYVDRSIEDLIYQQAVRVLMEGQNPSDLPASWTNAMQGLIRGEIGSFMSENNLSEYLASFGLPEVEIAESQERTIQLEQYKVASDDGSQVEPAVVPAPKFHSRAELSGIFSQFSDRFTRRARDRGVDLHWIGVGTWQIPDKIASDIVNGQHIMAWEINRENAVNGSEQAFEDISNEAYVEEKARLIQKVRSTSFRDNGARPMENRNLMRALLTTYWEQLGEAAEIHYNSAGILPPELEETIRRIERLLFRDQHYVGSKPPSKLRPVSARGANEKNPPAPATFIEEKYYRDLLRKLDGDVRQAEWLIQYEERKYPGLKREQVLQYLLTHPEQFKI